MLKEQKKTPLQKNSFNQDFEEAHKQQGFSLPSVIVGSIIAAVLGGMALTSMWGSVDKAAVAAEVGSIAEIKNAAAGLREDSLGYPGALDATNDANALARVGQLPAEFKYNLILATDGTDQYIALKAVAKDTTGRDRLGAIVTDLEARYGKDKFIYDLNCSDPATPATNKGNCYYATPIMAKSTMPTSILSTHTVIENGTAGSDTIGGAITQSGAITLLNPDTNFTQP